MGTKKFLIIKQKKMNEQIFDFSDIPFVFLGTSALTAFFLFQLKPSSMFNKDGSPKQLAITKMNEETTLFPWWVASIGIGYVVNGLLPLTNTF